MPPWRSANRFTVKRSNPTTPVGTRVGTLRFKVSRLVRAAKVVKSISAASFPELGAIKGTVHSKTRRWVSPARAVHASGLRLLRSRNVFSAGRWVSEASALPVSFEALQISSSKAGAPSASAAQSWASASRLTSSSRRKDASFPRGERIPGASSVPHNFKSSKRVRLEMAMISSAVMRP